MEPIGQRRIRRRRLVDAATLRDAIAKSPFEDREHQQTVDYGTRRMRAPKDAHGVQHRAACMPMQAERGVRQAQVVQYPRLRDDVARRLVRGERRAQS
ncbi:MAG TPA: hypothetical protein VG840_04750, partial [Casimicrobiaceae bacterium]|nr:hypothetical protein [Casimicrobiaceae bacterium]